MAHNIHSIADKLGAKVVAQIPDVGGGVFGAARLARVACDLDGSREGSPTTASTHPFDEPDVYLPDG